MRDGRKAGGVLLAGLMVVALAACGRTDESGGGSAGESTAASQAPEVDTGAASGEINVWAFGAEGKGLQVIADAFMSEHPEVTVEITEVPFDAAHDRLVATFSGGGGPDVTQIGTTWMGEFAQLGGLDPTPSNFDAATFFEGAWDTTVVDGTSYGVPWYVETRLVYYRTDLAEEGGVTAPPANWDELKAMAEAIQGAGADYGINLQPGGQGSWQTLMPFFWQAGGEIMDGEGNFTLDGQPCVDALTFYDSFFEDGLTAPAAGDLPLEGQFANGNVGSFISGPWMIGIVTEAGADPETWTVAHQPTQESGTSFVGGSNLGVLSDSDSKEAAWAFVEYVSQPEVQVTWYETVSALPSVQAAWDDEAMSGDDLVTAFGDQLNDAKAPPAIATWEEVASEIDAVIEQVTVGEMTPEEGCPAMQEAADGVGTGA